MTQQEIPVECEHVIDLKTGKIERIVDRTSNSYLVTRTKLTPNGINCTNWFTEDDFKKKFKYYDTTRDTRTQ